MQDVYIPLCEWCLFQKGVNLQVISDILDIYMTHIKLDNSETFMHNLSRLQDTVEHCVSIQYVITPGCIAILFK